MTCNCSYNNDIIAKSKIILDTPFRDCQKCNLPHDFEIAGDNWIIFCPNNKYQTTVYRLPNDKFIILTKIRHDGYKYIYDIEDLHEAAIVIQRKWREIKDNPYHPIIKNKIKRLYQSFNCDIVNSSLLLLLPI